MRQVVQTMASLLEAKLIRNDHKDNWKDMTFDTIRAKLAKKASSLNSLMCKAKRDPAPVLDEAVDLAAWSMFIVDKCMDEQNRTKSDHDNDDFMWSENNLPYGVKDENRD
jgi:hypothetical protein